MKVLIACEESQTVCKAFRERGHEAYSCDIQPPSGGHPEWHILGDAAQLAKTRVSVFRTMDGTEHNVDWDLLIAHPPCTYLSNAGARHLWKGHQLQADRVMEGIKARDFFMEFYHSPIPLRAIENPVPSRVFLYASIHPDYSALSIWPSVFQENLLMANQSSSSSPNRYYRAGCNMVPKRKLQP